MQKKQEIQIQSDNIRDKNDSISLDEQQLYNLPQRQKLLLSEQYHSIRNQLSIQKQNQYTQKAQKLVDGIDKVLESDLYSWEEEKQWKFNLPKTVFEGDQSPIKFFQPELVYGNQDMNRLTLQQMISIEQSGKFIVSGKNEESSKVWKVSPWIVRGQNYINECYYSGLSRSYYQLLQIKKRLGWKYAQNQFLGYKLFRPNFFNGLIGISCVFTKLASITIGTQQLNIQGKDQILNEIARERKKETIKMYQPEIKTSFFEYFRIKNDEVFYDEISNQFYQNLKSVKEQLESQNRIEDFNTLQKAFEMAANELEKSRLSELEKMNVEEKEALHKIFNEKQELLFSMILSSKYIKDKQVQEHFIELIKVTQITENHYFKLENDLKEYAKQEQNNLSDKHPIKSKVFSWIEHQINEFMTAKRAELQIECNAQIIKELEDNNLHSYANQFRRYTEFQQNQDAIYEQNYERIQKIKDEPSRVFKTFEQNKKPYKILSDVSYLGETYYFFDEAKTHLTPTSFLGWRLALLFTRYKAWTKNVYNILIDNMINGELGLKALFKTKPFPRDYNLDIKTGQLQEKLVDPYIYSLKESLNSIKQSLRDFEAQPDRGIIGKSISRVFKQIECLIRLALTASFIGIGMPVGIMINTTLSFLLAVTSWAWIPACLVLRQIFNMLIFDLDYPHSIDSRRQNDQRVISSQFFPLPAVVFDMFVDYLEVSISLASAFIIHPALSTFNFAITALRRAGQSLSDDIMCLIISLIGRQPEIDTFLAWKVGKAGDEQQQIYSMNIEDVQFLVRARLEEIELEEYQSRLLNKINEPSFIFDNLSKNLFQFYDLRQPDNRIIISSIEMYIQILQKQIEERKKNYPLLPKCNIKFTDEELQKLFFQSQNLVQSFVEPRKMDWVFQKFEIKQNDYKKLTEMVLIDIFEDSEILYPISEADKRIQIKTEKRSNFDSIYNSIISKSGIYSQNQIRFQKYKNNFLFPFIGPKEVQQNFDKKQINYSTILNPACEAFYFDHKDYEEIVLPKNDYQNDKN
ncbi:transmembrane protein, putative (macronuclear) [Tetrahymena thermophila SB210]|uniref:Transmembrane protein, putative n=1 Tax=Tetrahymena thermophila (strain SB210) TaxID=312017 RepID=I7M1Z2_TETTS|nr:transmembrane protein, putative [Tetrahymena thermophila SB210]EAR98162.1 transmembrane protein, putative [Tetrahymena thermophila SB210]|eukprot:XP_001018407.1 transmembrane protein, putative [Tetrahymena thermophila SB210]